MNMTRFDPADGLTPQQWVFVQTVLEQILMSQYASTIVSTVLWNGLTSLNKKISSSIPSTPQQLQLNLSSQSHLIESAFDSIAKQSALDLSLAVEAIAAHAEKVVRLGDYAMPKVSGSRARQIVDETLIDGAPSRDWWDKQSRDATFRFKAVVQQGVLDGSSLGEMGTEIRDAFNISGRQAEALIRTSALASTNAVRQEVMDANADLLDGQRFLATLDSRTTPICRRFDGLLWDMSGNPVGHRTPLKRPPLHWQCRSLLIPEVSIPGFESEGKRASIYGPISGKLTFETWLNTLTKTQLDSVLGPRRAELFADGKVTFSQLINADGRQLTLSELKSILEI